MATLYDFPASAPASVASRQHLTLFRWTLQSLAPYRRPVALLATLSAAEVACRVASPWALKAVVDHVFSSTPAPAWLRGVAGLTGVPLSGSARGGLLVTIVMLGLIAHLAHQAVLMLHTRLFAALGQRLTRDLREQLFTHLQCLALAHHARTPAGDAVYRLNADANCLEQIVLRAWIPAVSSAATLIVMFAVLATISVPLALVSLAVVPGLYLSLRLHSRRVSGEAERVKALESRLIERAHESFATIRLVKAFAREPYERARFSGASHDAMRARVSLSRREATFSFAVGALTASGTSLVLAAGGALVLRGDISAGTLLLVLAYLGFVYGPLTALTHTTSIIRDAFASARRVRQVFELTTEPLDVSPASSAPASLPIASFAGGVRFDHVSFAYEPNREVLHDITFTANPGELIAIVGPSGSGKTTITGLITRLYEPSRGRILLDSGTAAGIVGGLDGGRAAGIDSRAVPLRTLREQIAVVLQEALLLSGTVRDNLRYGRLDASDADIEEAARRANAHEFISRLPHGYDTELGEAGAMLSGGQRQRLSIARAFLKDSPMLVLDEPTSALDTLSESHFVEVLGRLRGSRTTFVIAHRLSTVRQADRILVLDAGRLVASGTHAELLHTSPLYAQLAGSFTDAAASDVA